MMNMRSVLFTGCAAVMVFGSLAVAAPAAADCSGNVSGAGGGSCTGSGPDVPTVDGIPCNSHHYGTCLGLSQDGAGAGGMQGIRPGSTVSHSP
jgi:hypothetical protein